MNRPGRKKWKTFSEVIQEAKSIITDRNISFDEIEQNTGVESEFTRIIFDDSTQTHQNISKIFNFLKLKFVSRRQSFVDYNVTQSGPQYRINRTIKPRCSMIYDKKKDAFFRFRYSLKTGNHSEAYTNIIKAEMQDVLYQHLG